ncbi:MAG: prephenate dehydrogenase/arogenate dehydrogenase family protein, partial [Desulfobacterales bacterium]|nr:prephenate dehydrogenase/arogenate dehydrogenase family protein [Desulfobacterales bacterium]
IGFGRFGKLTARYLAEDFEVLVFNRTAKSTGIKEVGARASSLKNVCRQKIVIVCVPISTLKQVLVEIGPLLKKDAVVVDVCSVKVYPSQWMKALLPETVSILATHPIFGPDSASDSLTGRKIFLSRIRISKKQYQKIKSYLASKELVIIESTPEDHDEQIAISLALTHFIGRTLSEFSADRLNIDSEGYKRLLHILDVVEHDTWQLFYDMHRYNPYAKEKRAAFMQAMQKINERLEG